MVYFTMYEQLRCFIKDRQDVEGSFFHQQPVWLTSLVAGGVGRTLAVTMVSPLELIRTKMQSQKLSYQGTAKISRNIQCYITLFH
jgi:solute carrier family 25 protein 39/40